MISANVISTGYGILESIKIHIENCWGKTLTRERPERKQILKETPEMLLST
ncbi:MAG: hypothetical protein ACQETR_09905 [Thermodesulfobacteriota bacterium]